MVGTQNTDVIAARSSAVSRRAEVHAIDNFGKCRPVRSDLISSATRAGKGEIDLMVRHRPRRGPHTSGMLQLEYCPPSRQTVC